MRKRIEKDTLIKILDCCIEDNCNHCQNAYKYGDIEVCEVLPRGYVTIPIAIMRETIEALKEQEPRAPHYTYLQYSVNGIVHEIKHPECPRCFENGLTLWDASIDEGQAYCKRCGQEVKWE